MEAQRWQRVKEVLQGALDATPEQRQAFLDAACEGDAALRAEVESLLAPEGDVEGFIEAPALERAGEEEGGEPRYIGSYQLIRRLGRGGMGEVWLASRTDDFDQRVAIKLIRRGLADDDLVGRFRYERQILAHLEHPNIARLLDGGSTADGLPFFVMEHVEGEPIHLYCDRHDVPLRRRLELFLAVCDAVACAHRSLVVHRDLKPANILVTADGVPKLLDFGIAKLLNAEVASPITRWPGQPLTPHYASPEQLRGQIVTTVSDVYSLGILLFELLTGQRPFDGEGIWDAETRSRGPGRPSAAVVRGAGSQQLPSRRRLGRHLAGDLDHIVLKALRPEPDERYASVEQLAADVRRHLAGRPVLARRGTWVYRLGKLVRRQRGPIALAVALLILAGVAVHDRVQAARVEEEAAKAELVGEFLVRLLTASDPNTDLTVREILDHGAETVDESLEEQPEVHAALLNAMGQVYRQHGEYETALTLDEKSLAIRRKTLGSDNEQVALSLNSLGLVLRSMGRFREAEARLREALEISRRELGPEHIKIAKILNNLAGVVQERGDFDSALALYRESLDMKRRVAAGGEDSEDIALALNNYGRGLESVGRRTEAETVYREALAIRERLFGRDHAMVAVSLNNLAVLLRDRGALGEAEELLRRSLAIRRRVFGPDHSKVAKALKNLAVCVQLRGDLGQAEELYLEALGMQRATLPEDHPEIAGTLRELATLHLARQEPDAAEIRIGEALDILHAAYPSGHWRIADAESVRGSCLALHGRPAEAEPLLRRSLEELRALRGRQSRETREAATRLADFFPAR